MKQTFGVVIIIVSFLIFTFGIGSDAVGGAAFGQWWPPVKEFGKQTFGPLKDAATDMIKSFKEAVKLLTCPTCAAREILQGVYTNPTGKGKTGSFGIEFEELSVPDGKITLGRPFSVNLGIKNQGGKEAKNVSLKLFLGGANRAEIGIKPQDQREGDPNIFYISKKLEQEDAKQFVAVGGLDCTSIAKTDLAKKSSLLRKTFIETGQEYESQLATDIKAEATYSYSVDSELTLEFIKKEERERLLKEKKLERRKEKSKITTSPVAVSLFVDIDQPIEEQTRFYLGIEVKSQEKDGKANSIKVVINLPDEFLSKVVATKKGLLDKLVETATGDLYKGEPALRQKAKEALVGGGKTVKENPKGTLSLVDDSLSLSLFITELKEGESTRVFLDFPQNLIELASPTKTVAITAQATFNFIKERTASVGFGFGGFCCPDIEGACHAGTRCEYNDKEKLGVCVAGSQEGSTNKYIFKKSDQAIKEGRGNLGYCNRLSSLPPPPNGNSRCELGWGGCYQGECKNGLSCTDMSDHRLEINLCCEDRTINGMLDKEACFTAFKNWVEKTEQITPWTER